MTARNVVFIYSPQLEAHHYPEDSPFRSERTGRLRGVLQSMGLLSGPDRREVAPAAADRRVLRKFHTAAYLRALRAAERGRIDGETLRMGIGTPDCPVFKGMYALAALAAGGTLEGAKLILDGQADIVFNASGGFHHAQPELAAGFCYLNDMAVACLLLAEAGKRVLYLDVDVHFGDGVAYAFYDRSDVMTISLHENPKMLFPGTGFEDEIGRGEGKGYCVNIPLPVGTYDEAYMIAFREVALPLISAYRPDVIVLELGVDALAGDPLAHLCLTNNTYADIIHCLLDFEKPILAAGGGGYHIPNTVRAWALAWTVFCGADSDPGMDTALGGVMLQSTDWQGGLRDRQLVPSRQQRDIVMPALEGTIETVKAAVFPIHGL